MSPTKLKWRKYGLVWPAIGFILWGIFYLNDTVAGVQTDRLNLLGLALGCALLWALVTPLIRKLARRWPLDETLRVRILLLHLVFSLVFSFLMSCVMTLVFMATAFWIMGYTLPFKNLFPGIVYYFGLVKVVFYWTVVAADSAFHYLQRFRHEAAQAAMLERQLGAAQLKVLRAQLQPHFLFNTLHSLAALIRMKEQDTALAVLVDLGDLLRMALKADHHQWVPLREEWFMVEKYIGIERQRFGDRATLNMVLDPGLEDEPVPPLLLQPLVENAVRHGLEADPDADWVQLEIKDQQDYLRIAVEDNGPGFPEDWSFENHSGTGLGHTYERLQGLYPGGIEVQVGSRPQGGGRVVLQIPKKEGRSGVKLKVLIVDDERLSRRNLELLLADEPLIHIVGSCDRASAVIPAVKTHAPDLIFLDIQMPKQNGLELMAQLREVCRPTPAIIFVTAHEQFAVQAFGLHAMDYLLKPFSEARLREAIAHARSRIMTEREANSAPPKTPQVGAMMVIKERGQIMKIACDQVLWVEAADHYLVLHCQDQRHVWRKSLRAFLQAFEQVPFWQVHRSAAVNGRHVRRIYRDQTEQAWVELTQGKPLRASRRRYRHLLAQLGSI